MYQTDVWSVRCIRCHSRCKEQNKWRRFVVLSLKKSFDEFRNTPNVGNNSKTSCCFPFMRSVTSCNWFLAVTEKSFCIAIRLGHREDISSPQPSNRVKMVDSQPS